MPLETSTDAVSDYRTERDRFVAFAFAAADLLIEVGADHRVAYVAGAAKALTGRDAGQLVGSPFRDLFAETHRGFAHTLLRRVRHDRRIEPVILSFDRRGADGVSVVLNGCCLRENAETLYFTVSRSVPPHAEDGADRDGETGLLARPAFQAAAAAALNQAAAARRDLTLTLLDLAGIDEMRVGAGDGVVSDLLGEIGDFLSAQAVDGASAGRLAPNRFGVVRDGAKSTDLQGEIERLSQAHAGDGPGLGVKERILPLSPGGLTAADAEKALAYTLGRFAAGGAEALPIRSLADGLRELVADTVGRISRLRSSVGDDRLAIVFQPVVDLAGRRVQHYEVLSRFEGEKSPAETVQFAEGVGLIEELDLTVCQRALAFMESWHEDSTLKLAVNLSGRSLGSDVFVAALHGLLKPRGDRGRLLFEITETTAIADLPRTERIIQDLRRAGYKVCLDDFGAGAASFPYLQALTVDFVKIDGAYVHRMLDAPRDRAILKAMVSLCGDLNIATIAERIETEAQAHHLAQLGVRYGQGFLFGRPAATPATTPRRPRSKSVFVRRSDPVKARE